MKIRKSFVMSVYPEYVAEYANRRAPIWPEMEAVLMTQGVQNYSIFLLPETCQLFAYAEIEDERQWQRIAQAEVCSAGGNICPR